MKNETIKNLEKLALNGNVEAIQELGIRYYRGLDVEIDYQKAKGYFDRANSAGCKGSAYYLGMIYYNGNGVPVDHVKAKEYFEKSDANSNVFSTYYLGKLYYWGDGVEKNEAKANEYKTKVLEKPFFANQNTNLCDFYSISDIELSSRVYANAMEQKVKTEFQNLYGNLI